MADTSTRREPKLSPREIEAGKLIARGMTIAEVGQELGVSRRTAKSYCDMLRLKLGVERKREIPDAMERLGITVWPQNGRR